MRKRATLIANGEVQKVGYRDFVQKVARKLGVVGYVENLRDGSVKIVCEGDESAVEALTEAIRVKVKFIDVKELSVVETGDATGEFEYFEIRRGEMAEELGERLDTAVIYLDATKEELKGEMRSEFGDLKKEMKEGFKETKEGLHRVENAVISMHTDVNHQFGVMGEKYGVIAKGVEKIDDKTTIVVKELQNTTKALVPLTEKIGALIDKKLAE
ncbi:MAG: acylphosphatase [Candidatus Thermoplasmatota archaeon]